MTHSELLATFILVGTALNLPFGAWRTTTRKFSWQWFASIHVPIPFIILLRLALGLSWWYVPVSLGCAVAGQLLGGWLWVRYQARRQAVPKVQVTD